MRLGPDFHKLLSGSQCKISLRPLKREKLGKEGEIVEKLGKSRKMCKNDRIGVKGEEKKKKS